MAKEWILNQALNKKKSVGPVSELIRNCAPKDLEHWKEFYYKNAYSEFYLKEIGRKIYIKISEIIKYEVEEVTEQDCIDYVKIVIINRTFDGYQNEIRTIYGQLNVLLDKEIKPAPDEWE